jgi:hypothetical protein
MSLLSPNYDEFNKFNNIKFSVSARNKPTNMFVREFLVQEYGFLRYDQIDTIYGFTKDLIPLYGGRSFKPDFTLTENDLSAMYEDGIGLRLPLSSSLVNKQDYEDSQWFLEKHHREGNVVVVTVKKLAEWIKKDFPLYTIDCSTIKNYTPKQIDNSFKDGLYDNTVLSARFNDDPNIVNIKNKDKVIVFANSKCGWTCQTPTCYMQVSQHNKGLKETFKCSEDGGPEKVIFNLKRLIEMGFLHFKLTPINENIGVTLGLL